nr:MAG TPA: hypothetical protein [Crassvirales sp.]
MLKTIILKMNMGLLNIRNYRNKVLNFIVDII